MKVKIYASYGVTSGSFRLPATMTVGEARHRIARHWGYDLDETQIVVKGAPVTPERLVAEGDNLEFVKKAGDGGLQA